jgi:expansin (peptidoglycan-binding protein)
MNLFRKMQALFCLVVLFSAGCGNGSRPIGTISCDSTEPLHTGEATYYTFANGDGACMFGPSSEDPLLVGAMNHDDYAGAAVCGACVNLTGPNGAVGIRIVDECPECPAGNIDLSPQAFERIAPLELGRVPISWRYASCTVSGPIVYHFKDGSNQWWTAVQIRNHSNRVAKLEYDVAGEYHEVARTDYNYFVQDSGMGPGPYDFRVTDIYGNVLEDSGIEPVENGSIEGTGQFPPCGKP